MAARELKFFEIKIDTSSLKLLSSALHLLQKIGRELIIEVEETLFTLRALNDNKSAFCCIEFNPSLFDTYRIVQQSNRDSSSSSFTCKVPIRPITQLFKNLKQIRHLTLYANQRNSEHFLTFEWSFFNGISKINAFHFMDSEVLNAIFDENSCSFVKMKPKLMIQLFEHLSLASKLQGEVLLIASASNFSVKSYHSPELQLELLQDQVKGLASLGGRGKRGAGNKLMLMNTGLSIHLQEFDSYEYRSHQAQEQLIFTMKEVGSFVAFCEANDLEAFDFHFSSGGSAMKLSSQTEFLIVSLILATVESDQEQVGDPQPQPAHHSSPPEQPQRHRQSNQQESEAEEEEENEGIDRPIVQSVSAANGLLSRRALTAMTEPIDRPAIEQPPQSKATSPKKKVNPRKRWLEASSSDEDDNR